MRCPQTQIAIFATACLLGNPLIQAQSAVPAIQTGTSCQLPSTSENKQSSDPQITIEEVGFSGVVQMAVSDQDQIVALLKQRKYAGTLDGVTDEVLERVKAAWQDHGYLNAEVSGDVKTLASNPMGQRIALSVHVDEGLRYKLGQVTFKNNKAVTNTKTLRSLIPIRDGDIFDRSKIAKGLENLQKAYGQLGYINFTSIPNTTFDEEKKLVLLNVDFDEGKQFYLRGIDIVGLDDNVSGAMQHDFLLKPGQVYNQRLFEMSMKRLSVPHSSALRGYQIHPDQTDGTVTITITFEQCPAH